MTTILTRHDSHRQDHYRGFTLLEVLVTLVVISVGLLSIAQLQARALQFSYASLQRTVATVQVNDLIERMWTGVCDATDPITILEDWGAESWNHALLPGWGGPNLPSDGDTAGDLESIGLVDLTIAPTYTISIGWSEARIAPERPILRFTFQMIDPAIEC